jgi:hypothetical protein
MTSFQKVKREHAVLRQKLEAYFQVIIPHNLIHNPLFCNLHHDLAGASLSPVFRGVFTHVYMQLLQQAGPAGAATRPAV